jgi:hypothetical protein
LQRDLQARQAPLQAVNLSALHRGHRISVAEEDRPHDGQGVTAGI